MNDKEGKKRTNQRIYGRGLYDGLKLAGITNPGEVMNTARMKALEDGLNGFTKKVYAAIPLERAVSVHEVVRLCSEGGVKIDGSAVRSAVSTLIAKGLVRGDTMSDFRRVPPKPVIVRKAQELEPESHVATDSAVENEKAPDAPTLSVEPQKGEVSPLDRLAVLEGKVRALSATITDLANEIFDVAVNVEEFIERVKHDNAKVAQLKELLKNL